jgi:outer membrane lipoprotein-sorting protein
MTTTKLTIIIGLLVSLTGYPVAGNAETAAQKGLKIATEADRLNSGFQDTTAKMHMVLRNKAGRESRRQMRYWTLEGTSDGDRTLMLFDTPSDVRGTAMLTHSHGNKPDDQWMYLPAFKRVKRISSANRTGSFMGSEFAYEDLGSPEVSKYTYRWQRDETCGGGQKCNVNERIPVDKHSGYSRQLVWSDYEHYRPYKIEFYDRQGALQKTLTFSGYQQYQGHYWRADLMQMNNHQTGKSTDLKWLDYKFKVGLEARRFKKNQLKRAR